SSSLGTSLSYGARGAAVTALKQQLISLGFLAAGNASGYFGNLTKSAVMAFQAQQGFEQVGSVGPKTRAALSALASGGAGAPLAAAAQPSQNNSLLAALLAQLAVLQEKIAELKSGTQPAPSVSNPVLSLQSIFTPSSSGPVSTNQPLLQNSS